jgi:phosphopantothenoylcysteine decarboxylase/phosphopantothenate--cysteine ligase
VKRLDDRRILLGVTGSIAAYKACELLRLLKKMGADVRVVMTEAATHFVHPLTFETLSGNEVVLGLFPEHRVVKTRHISTAEWAECILVCPATADSIGKMASGIADDFLSTVVMASRSPVLLAPAMDAQMIRHPAYVRNCRKLKSFGYRFIEPESGELASGLTGCGRLAGFDGILHAVRMVLLGTDGLKDKRILVTAGPTREPLDPVRYISNRSSGRMGFALAEEACLRGARVTLVHGNTFFKPPEGVRTIACETAGDMSNAVKAEWPGHDILAMAAAVADYRPDSAAEQKIKKNGDRLVLGLEKTADILQEAAAGKAGRLVVGFALETENGEKNALEKMAKKKLDLVCLNSPFDAGSGFETDTTRITLFDRSGGKTQLPLLPKGEAAARIWDAVEKMLKG